MGKVHLVLSPVERHMGTEVRRTSQAEGWRAEDAVIACIATILLQFRGSTEEHLLSQPAVGDVATARAVEAQCLDTSAFKGNPCRLASCTLHARPGSLDLGMTRFDG